MTMKYRYVAFHTMARGSGKPEYVVNCAKALADRGIQVLVLDGLMYEQGAILHRFYEVLGSAPKAEDGNNLYDLIRDYEILCAGNGAPPGERDDRATAGLSRPDTKYYRGRLYPDVAGRTSPIQGHPSISYLPGNNGKVVEVRARIDFQELYENCDGQRFFQYLRDALAERFDVVLMNAPAGHQEISGIICGQLADLILAIDLDSPAVEVDASFEACKRLAQRASETDHHSIAVQRVKGHSVPEVVDMILESQ